MKKPTISKVVLFFGLFIATASIPNFASARTSVQIQLPGFSFGVSNRNYRQRYNQRYNQRYYDNRYRSYRYTPQYNSRTYRSYNNGSYINRSYNYSPSRRIYTPSYQSSICPTPGYSQYYYEGHGCYQHKDHYHCD